MSTEIVPTGPTTSPSPRRNDAPTHERRGGPKPIKEPPSDFAELRRILRKRKALIVKVTCVVFVLALAYTLVATPKFRSESTIEFNKQNSDTLGLDQQQLMLGDANSIDYIVTQQTQVKALLSDSLALQVIKELNLESRPEFSKTFSAAMWKFLYRPPDESKLLLEKAPYRRVAILKFFHKNLKVMPVAGTRLISIVYMSPDRQVASTVVNTLVNDYTERYFQNRYTATMEASGWLSSQLEELRANVANTQQRLVDYQKEAGILGTDESHNIVMTRLAEGDKQLMDAEANKILAHTVAQLVREGHPELVASLMRSPEGSDPTRGPIVTDYLDTLRKQQSDLKLQYAQAATQYGGANPKLIEIQTQLDQSEENIQQELRTLSARAETDYRAAQQTEAEMRSAFEAEKLEANKLNDSAVQYTLLKHEAESSRALYDGLLAKFKEAGVLAGLRSSNIVVVDAALPADRPARPIVALNLGLGLFVGLLFGVCAAFVIENVDDKIDTADEAEEVAMVPALGVVPTWKYRTKLSTSKELAPGSGICVLAHPRSQPAEAFRAIRTSILQSLRKGQSTAILVTSASPGEGKSTVSMNCAAALAQQGAKVLLVEADMRRPTFNAQLNLGQSTGLSSMIKGEPCSELPVKLSTYREFAVIPAGPASSYPAELLGSERMKELITTWKTQYDFILVDTPPALTVTDAVALAPYCDVVILVARARVTRRPALVRVSTIFARIRPRVLGVILNGLDTNGPESASYYGYDAGSKPGAGYYSALPK